MKEVMCIAAFAGKVFCLAVFIVVLRPEAISAVNGSMKPAYCEVRRPTVHVQGISAAATQADVGNARPGVAHC